MNNILNGGFGFDTARSEWLRSLKPYEPCDHRGCLSHVTHPCEGCGRIAGRPVEETNYHGNNREAACTLKTGVVSLSGISDVPPLCFTNEPSDSGS